MNMETPQKGAAAKTTNQSSRKPPTPAKIATAPSQPLIAYDGKPPVEDLIRMGAYLRWEAAGRPEGDGVGFWLDSERDFLRQTMPFA